MKLGRISRVGIIALTVSALLVCGDTHSIYGKSLVTLASESSRTASSSQASPLSTHLDDPEESRPPADDALPVETTTCTPVNPGDPSEDKEMSTGDTGCEEDTQYSDILAEGPPTDEWTVNPYYVVGGLAILGGAAAAIGMAGGGGGGDGGGRE